ncbi:MAG TPA: class I adenylate-forming enzyme family protein [Anaerolineae bacterium]|nr:class I adenylate-forming enzyme family protein [Anaerolineae bacterium]
MLNGNMTLAEALREVARTRTRREALVCGGTRLTYGELLEEVEALGAGLHGQGIRKGDRIVCLLPPSGEHATLFFAAAVLGAVLVPLSPQARPRQLNEVLADAQPGLLVTERPPEREVQVPPGTRVVHTGPSAPEGSAFAELMAHGDARLPEQAVAPEDLHALLYTSGTTGKPKGAMHSHRSLIAPVVASLKVRELWTHPTNLRQVGELAIAVARYRERLVRMVGQPFTFLSTAGWHSMTGIQVMLEALLMGDKLVAMAQFEPRECLELIQRERASLVVAVPMAYQVMLSLEDLEKYDTSSLVICGTGAAPCPPELGREIQRRFGCALYIGFGATETGGGVAITSLSDSSQKQAETVGRPLPGVRVRIVDEQHREVPRGEVGELACQGQNIMLGYYRDPELSAAAVDAEGWYFTGDLARLDEQGYLHIVGRKKDMIVRAGQNVYPVEIEHYLVAHPKIREAAVIGVPAGAAGESVWAYVRLEEGAAMSAQEVKQHCRQALEAYKVPALVRFVEDFPRGELGKPQKFRLREMALQELREAKDGR